MRKAIFLFILLVHVAGLYAQINVKSGLLVSGGGVSSTYDAAVKFSGNDRAELNPLLDAGIGYRFRLQPERQKFFVDLDLQAGLRRIQTTYYQNWFNPETPETRGSWSSQITHSYIRFSISPTFNYRFYDGWYAGLGVEPEFYTASGSPIKGGHTPEEGIDRYRKFSGFDVPLTARLGYDFKYMDVAFGYKYGLLDVLTPVYFYGGKVRAWQVQVFIPF
ncbi:MAG: hypothetical protein LBP50_10755 [Tannerella sp.]|jgi:hypothetical protein|nr:hypothetical protein [Tannerella sp.]